MANIMGTSDSTPSPLPHRETFCAIFFLVLHSKIRSGRDTHPHPLLGTEETLSCFSVSPALTAGARGQLAQQKCEANQVLYAKCRADTAEQHKRSHQRSDASSPASKGSKKSALNRKSDVQHTVSHSKLSTLIRSWLQSLFLL